MRPGALAPQGGGQGGRAPRQQRARRTPLDVENDPQPVRSAYSDYELFRKADNAWHERQRRKRGARQRQEKQARQELGRAALSLRAAALPTCGGSLPAPGSAPLGAHGGTGGAHSQGPAAWSQVAPLGGMGASTAAAGSSAYDMQRAPLGPGGFPWLSRAGAASAPGSAPSLIGARAAPVVAWRVDTQLPVVAQAVVVASARAVGLAPTDRMAEETVEAQAERETAAEAAAAAAPELEREPAAHPSLHTSPDEYAEEDDDALWESDDE